MADAQEKVDAWREGYNESRPHSSLGDLTPAAFAARGQEADQCRPDPVAESAEGDLWEAWGQVGAGATAVDVRPVA